MRCRKCKSKGRRFAQFCYRCGTRTWRYNWKDETGAHGPLYLVVTFTFVMVVVGSVAAIIGVLYNC